MRVESSHLLMAGTSDDRPKVPMIFPRFFLRFLGQISDKQHSVQASFSVSQPCQCEEHAPRSTTPRSQFNRDRSTFIGQLESSPKTQKQTTRRISRNMCKTRQMLPWLSHGRCNQANPSTASLPSAQEDTHLASDLASEVRRVSTAASGMLCE